MKRRKKRDLTRRQVEILLHAEYGHSIQETAEAIGVAFKTVQGHRREVSRRLGCQNILSAIRISREKGYLPEAMRP